MAIKIKNETKIGIMFVAAIAALIFGINFLKGNSIFSKHKEFYTIYENVQGLQEAAAVQINGFTVGKVIDIDLQEDKTIKVIFTITKNVNITRGTEAKLVTSDLISGTKAISLVLGNNNDIVENKSFVQGIESGGILDNISENVSPLVSTINNVIIKLDTLVNSFNQVLNAETRVHLKNSMKSLDLTMAELTTLSQDLHSQTRNVGTFVDEAAATVKNFNQNNEKLNSTFDNLQSISNKLNQAEIEKTFDNLHQASEEVKSMITKINDSEGSLNLILNDKKLYHNLSSSLNAMDSLLIDIKKHPAKYINISVFGSRERK